MTSTKIVDRGRIALLEGRMAQESLTRATAHKLRELALAAPEGTFLGTEKDLTTRLGVSRPTFRQAMNIVVAERAITSARGYNGGLFSRRPDLEGVVSSAATYLRSRETTVGDMLIAANAALVEAVGMAAESQDEKAREHLNDLVADLVASEHQLQSIEAFRAEELRATFLIARMTGNAAIEFMIRVFYRVGMAAFEGIFFDRPHLMRLRRTSRLRILRAIQEQDADEARSLCQRNGRLSTVRIDPNLLARSMQTIGETVKVDEI